jgi:hypothetical protein
MVDGEKCGACNFNKQKSFISQGMAKQWQTGSKTTYGAFWNQILGSSLQRRKAGVHLDRA